jgi:hypothetical protein
MASTNNRRYHIGITHRLTPTSASLQTSREYPPCLPLLAPLSTPDAPITVSVAAVLTLAEAGPQDVYILAVKAHQVEPIAADLGAALAANPEAVLIPMQVRKRRDDSTHSRSGRRMMIMITLSFFLTNWPLTKSGTSGLVTL